MQSIQAKKIEFAKKEISSMVFRAALIRGVPFYKESADEQRIVEFKDYLLRNLERFSKKYPDEGYIKILNDFQREINESEFVDIIAGEKITFGRVQKLLNLYLKYLWVFNLRKDEPSHCVIDSIILGKIKWKGPAWTRPEFTEIEYLKAIEMCGEKAKNMELSLAQWELLIFQDRADTLLSKTKALST